MRKRDKTGGVTLQAIAGNHAVFLGSSQSSVSSVVVRRSSVVSMRRPAAAGAEALTGEPGSAL